MRKHFNQHGFTLVEILVVIAIIAILFVTLLPQIDNAVQKARVNNVRNDLRAYQQMTHSFLLNTRGQVTDVEKYNAYLDNNIHFKSNNETTVTDPWGKPYVLQKIGKIVVIASGGKDEKIETKEDNILLSMYVNRDYIDVCTFGFDPKDIQLKMVKLPTDGVCGDDPVGF